MALGERDALPISFEPEAARRWLGLALGVLVAAGICAVAVVVGRTPPFDRFVTDPLFFKRCLVAHVNFALVAWFYSFTSALLRKVSTARFAWASSTSCGDGSQWRCTAQNTRVSSTMRAATALLSKRRRRPRRARSSR